MMNLSRATLTSHFLAFAAGFAILFSAGCNQEPAGPTGAQDHAQQVAKGNGPSVMSPGDTSQCATSSGILPANTTLMLVSSNSRVEYKRLSVLLPTPVSFSICHLDSTGTTLRSKAAVLGPISFLQFLKTFTVTLSLVDAGLPANTSNGTFYTLYRQNELNGQWNSVLTKKTSGNQVQYDISRNGTYAITLDSTLNITGVIPPSGGSLSLSSSSITFPSGALRDSTLVDFTLTSGITPAGLPGATDRIFDFLPEGIVFQTPVTLRVSFCDAGIVGEKTPKLRCYYFNSTTSAWEPQPTVQDWQNQQFVVTLSHFSRYAFGR